VVDEPTRLNGWYPINEDEDGYWDGTGWKFTRPVRSPATSANAKSPSSSPPQSPPPTSNVLIAGIGAASVIGLVMTFQTVSLMSGTGTIWTGVAIAAGAAVFAGALKVPVRVRIAAVVLALFAIGNAVSVENQLDEKRQEISDIGSELGQIGE
jgi:hypothetical protein